eukprot:12893395-Prorocentrum_lima.AAC.1
MEAMPKHIQAQCKNYGLFDSIGVLVPVMREVMPAADYSRLVWQVMYRHCRPRFQPPRQVWPDGWRIITQIGNGFEAWCSPVAENDHDDADQRY